MELTYLSGDRGRFDIPLYYGRENPLHVVGIPTLSTSVNVTLFRENTTVALGSSYNVTAPNELTCIINTYTDALEEIFGSAAYGSTRQYTLQIRDGVNVIFSDTIYMEKVIDGGSSALELVELGDTTISLYDLWLTIEGNAGKSLQEFFDEDVSGTPGIDGTDGTNGLDGSDGADGVNGTNGTNGADGAAGTNGTNGTNGLPGVDGTDGLPGADGADGADGGMDAMIYDPNVINGDAFDMANMVEGANANILTDAERASIDMTNYTTTGVISGGVVTETTPTTYNISAGYGVILNYSNPLIITKTLVTWAAEANLPIPNIGQPFTLNMVTGDNTIEKISRSSSTTPTENRSKIQLQGVIHNSGVQIDNITHTFRPSFGVMDAILDYLEKNGVINEGNLYKANGANLQLDRNSGLTTIPFINIIHDLQAPVTKTDNAALAVLVSGAYQDGIGGSTFQAPTASLNTTLYDDGSGTLAAIPNNQFVNHRLTFFSDGDVNGFQYGQVTYATEADAINALYTESFNVLPIAASGSTTTFVTVQQAETDLTNATFTENKNGGGGSGATPSGVLTVSGGTDVTVDNTDLQNPIVNFTGDAGIPSDITGITGADVVTNIVSLTQAEYDAIGTPDASTFYIIAG